MEKFPHSWSSVPLLPRQPPAYAVGHSTSAAACAALLSPQQAYWQPFNLAAWLLMCKHAATRDSRCASRVPDDYAADPEDARAIMEVKRSVRHAQL